ncbi:N-acyl homoserine lactonase family protein [Microbacterium sp. USTB-Y]|uniref:N-acyl homoserine lactonase family protein n=1 Tax=Microbacterium sp. USTB-Y TaxID=2823692 RepID=UPI00203A68F7|nr:N-acyl homoserine lactonase family protein [Microbacterium sp. USTB-Y]
MSLEIHPVCVGRINGLHMPSVTYLRGWGERFDTVFIMFAITGGASPIIVDTGPPDADTVKRLHGHDLIRAVDEHPAAALEKLGIDPAEVRTVINTHLHWDHSSNNDLFPNAEVIVQRSEVDYAIDPVEWHNVMFERLPGVQSPWRRAEDRIRTVEGDTEIAEGVSVIALPGHTPGSQGVLVQGADRRYLLAGDTVNAYVNWEGDATASHIPSGLYTSITDYAASFATIDSLDCEVIPSHDRAVLDHGPFL